MTVSVVPSATEALPAPRNVVVRFRLGQIFGEPDRVAQQHTIVRDSLRAIEGISETGGRIDLPYRWKREEYPPVATLTPRERK